MSVASSGVPSAAAQASRIGRQTPRWWPRWGSSMPATPSSSLSIRRSQVLPLRDDPRIQARPSPSFEITSIDPRGGPAARPARLALLSGDRPLELLLAHLRAAIDVELPRLVVELLAGPALRSARARALASAPRRGDVLGGGPRALLRLARTRALLLHRPRR